MNENNKKSQSALREEKVLKFWKENRIFEKSLEKEAPKGKYIFYDGPVTANSKPVLHTMEPFSFKDVIPRYKTMQGYYVRRKGGWDTHGLPVELQIEKKLGFKSKNEIEKYGITAFNKLCKESVWEYIELWKSFTNRIGYWADQDNSYVTYSNNFIESVWNVIKEVEKQDLLYKDYKVVPWCPRCGTGLSSHELAQGYEDIKDLSVTAKFPVRDGSALGGKVSIEPNTFILAWTTTPWTLPGNVALAVGEKIDYAKLKVNNEFLILAKTRLSIIEGEYEIVEELKGKDLVGLEYEPLYPYLKDQLIEKGEDTEKAFKVYPADFVTTEDGTGVVHTAVMYGIDDFTLGTDIGLPKHHMVGLDGKFLEGTDFLEGRFVRDEEVAVDIIKDLAHRGLLFKKEKYEHSYPHCWRCHTALIYYARDSWYIRMSSLRDKLIDENKDINWEPAHIKEGRFGEWLREVKDWAISRERYWGTPLPVWECNKCEKKEVIGSIEDLKSKTKKSRNKYFIMRHGEADHNIKNVFNCESKFISHLTEKGKDQVKETALLLKDKKIDIIFSSPFTRTIETVNIIKDGIGFNGEIIFDERLKEINSGDYEGKTIEECTDRLEVIGEDKFYLKFPNGENHNDVRKRVGNFLYEIESNFKNKNILIVTHGDPVWLIQSIINGLDAQETFELEEKFPEPAKVQDFDFIPLPHNENYELDLHRPYIDEVDLVCDCGGKFERTKEVMDVWLDSGTMPFSQDHYPFENKEFIDGPGYPADFISEAIDQTRGWFYTLHAIGVLMGKGKAYKNVICLGHLLDANGKKMSKSVGNVVDPWVMIDKYGADTLRLWMYAVNQPGESKNFDEKTVAEIHNKVFNLLYNVLAFYELYRDKDLESPRKALPLENPRKGLKEANILDLWILTRLDQLTEEATTNLDNYKLLEPVRAIREFIDELSTWYVRRSRERLKDGNKDAKRTLYYVLKTLIKLMAPFTPFASEDIWQKLKTDNNEESIHLTKWVESKKKSLPEKLELKKKKVSSLVIDEMKKTREVVTLGLQARQKASLPVRQPLQELQITNYKLGDDYLEIIKDEVNIKNIVFVDGKELKVEIDTNITPELKLEGQSRELVRAIQDLRKKEGLNPSDIITLKVQTNVEGQELLNKFEKELLKSVNAKEIKITETSGIEIKINKLDFIINIS